MYLVAHEKADGLERLFASVDVVPEEKVVAFWWEAAVLKLEPNTADAVSISKLVRN